MALLLFKSEGMISHWEVKLPFFILKEGTFINIAVKINFCSPQINSVQGFFWCKLLMLNNIKNKDKKNFIRTKTKV